MLTSLALIFLCAMMLSKIFRIFRLPGIIGMLLTGIILGPYVLNLIDGQILSISADLKQLALIVILLRAGLALDIKDLKKIGKPALLLSFIPSTLEIVTVMVLAPIFFGVSIIEAGIMGCVLAAVSPAIILPSMLKLIEKGYGKEKSIPQLIMASASLDNIYVIVLFALFLSAYDSGGFYLATLVNIPISIVLGVALGVVFGIGLVWFFKKFHMKDTVKVIIIFCISFLFIALQDATSGIVPISGLLAVITVGITILKAYPILANRLQSKFSKIWLAAGMMLFVLVGTSVDLTFASKIGMMVFVLLAIAIIIRLVGVFISLIGSGLNMKEKLFCMLAFVPKATVQAAIGAMPLAMGIPSGNLILSIAVLAIFITAPIGALGIDLSYNRLLSQESKLTQ